MDFVKCHECGNEVSNKAIICPKCGVSLKKQNNNVSSKTNGAGKLLNVLAIIFLALYSIFGIYMVYTNVTSFFDSIDYLELVDITYYMCWIFYYIGSLLALWMMLAYNITNNKMCKMLSGAAIGVAVFFALIYYFIALIHWTEDIDTFFDLLGGIFQSFFGYYGVLVASYLLFINKK